jgi:tyrosyl-tRNA synthetase
MGQELTGFFREAIDRGFVHNFSRDLLTMNDLFEKQKITGYIGFDCTADSLHVGNLASLMLLRLFKKNGHIPVVVMGTATSRVGDPSGKDEQRTMITDDQIRKNMTGILPKIRRIVDPHWIVENHEFTNRTNVIDFLTDVGQHFSVNRMLTQDSVKNRLDRGTSLSFLEFSYMTLQAHDFVRLSGKPYNCVLQMGGSDQWGNICMGIELGRKMKGIELFGLTTPLITTAAGTKMGKTVDGAVWLNAERLTPYEYWQFWRNTADADVVHFLKLFTEIPITEIDHLKGLQGRDLNTAKIILANEATAICHGRAAALEAHIAANNVFEAGGSEGLPVIEIVLKPNEKIRLAEVFVKAGLVGSIGAAKRLAHDGGAYIHGDCRVEEDRMIEPAGFYDKSTLKISAGKKRHVLVRFLVR